METFLLVMQIIALAAVTALCVYLITVLVRVRSLLETIEHDFREMSTKAIPVLENLESITDKIKSITESIGEQVDAVRDSISSMKDVADSIAAFERRVQEHIELALCCQRVGASLQRGSSSRSARPIARAKSFHMSLLTGCT